MHQDMRPLTHRPRSRTSASHPRNRVEHKRTAPHWHPRRVRPWTARGAPAHPSSREASRKRIQARVPEGMCVQHPTE
eukprot:6183109-Pleurochrysis_carterae.AAC.3